MAVYTNKTQKLENYRYVCMHASYASSTAAHVSSNGSRHPSEHQPSSSRGLCWWELYF